jgi:hypothetical protein
MRVAHYASSSDLELLFACSYLLIGGVFRDINRKDFESVQVPCRRLFLPELRLPCSKHTSVPSSFAPCNAHRSTVDLVLFVRCDSNADVSMNRQLLVTSTTVMLCGLHLDGRGQSANGGSTVQTPEVADRFPWLVALDSAGALVNLNYSSFKLRPVVCGIQVLSFSAAASWVWDTC